MKTITRITLMLGLLVAIYSTNAFSQASLAQLQAMESAINADISSLQADITSMQAVISSLDAQIAEENLSGNEVPELESQRQDLLDDVVLKQNTLADKQAELIAVQNEMANVTAWNNQQDKNWIAAHNPPPVVTPANQMGNITEITHPALPNTPLMIFVPSGNTNHDDQLVHSWLLQHGLVDY